MIKPIFFFLIVLLPIDGFSQSDFCNKDQVLKVFKKIIKIDASHENANELRAKIFLTNFNTIVYILSYNYVLDIKEAYSKKQTKIIFQGVQITLIHMLQVYPDSVLNDSVIYLFKKEILEDRLDRKIFNVALSTYLYDNRKIRESGKLNPKFYKALSEWGIKEAELFFNY